MKKLSVLMIIIASILWGLTGIFVRQMRENGISTFNIVAMRSFVAVIFIFLFCLITNKSSLKIRLKDIWVFVGTGIISILMCHICYFTTIERTSLSTACILMYTSPIFIMVLSRFIFKEKLTVIKIIALILTFGGCVLCSYKPSESGLDFTSFLIGLGSGLGYGLYSIFSRIAINKGYKSYTVTFYTFVFSSIGCLFIANYSELGSLISNGTFDWVSLIVCSVLCTAIPYILYTTGLKGTDNGKASVISAVEIVTATLMGIIYYGEKLDIISILGIISVITAIILLQLNFLTLKDKFCRIKL